MMSLSKSAISLVQSKPVRHQYPVISRCFSSVNVDQKPKKVKDGSPVLIRHTKKEAPAQGAQTGPLNVHLAITKMREQRWAKFNETVELSVNLGVDPRKPNQSIKVRMPSLILNISH